MYRVPEKAHLQESPVLSQERLPFLLEEDRVSAMTGALPVDLCGCGQLLYPVFDQDGKRIGVNHPTPEEDDFHLAWTKNLWFGHQKSKDKPSEEGKKL